MSFGKTESERSGEIVRVVKRDLVVRYLLSVLLWC